VILTARAKELHCGQCRASLALDEHSTVAAAEVAAFIAAHQHNGGMSIQLDIATSPLQTVS
jgi:hypothetical protein